MKLGKRIQILISLRDSDQFHNWVEEQPKWVQNALYENTDDLLRLYVLLICIKLIMDLPDRIKKIKQKHKASLVDRGSKDKSRSY